MNVELIEGAFNFLLARSLIVKLSLENAVVEVAIHSQITKFIRKLSMFIEFRFLKIKRKK